MTIYCQDGVPRRPVIVENGQAVNVSEAWSVSGANVNKIWSKPSTGKIWVPKYNGTACHISIPTIQQESDFEIEIDFYMNSLGYYGILGTGSLLSYIYVDTNGKINCKFTSTFIANPNDPVKINKWYKLKLVTTSYRSTTVYLNGNKTVSFSNQYNIQFDRIGRLSAYPSYYLYDGMIRNFKFTSNSDSRFYPMSVESATMPGNDQAIIDTLGNGSTNGQMVGFDSNNPWVELTQ